MELRYSKHIYKIKIKFEYFSCTKQIIVYIIENYKKIIFEKHLYVLSMHMYTT